MVTPVKTDNIFFGFGGLPIVEVSANGISKSDVLDVATIFLAQLYIHYCPTGTGAITVGPELAIQGTPFPTGDAGWLPVISPLVFGTLTPNSSAVDGTEAPGSTLIEEVTTTGLANGQLIFFKNGTFQNSEWSRIQAVSAGSSFTIFDGLLNGQTGSTWFNQGQHLTPIVDLGGVKRLRAVVNNNTHATARAIAVRVGMVQLSDIVV
jgi:hypothetical protein